MWLCSRHHRPSPKLLRLAKPKPSSRNVNPLPLPFPSLPPAAGNTHSTVPAYGRDHPGASRERTPAWHVASVLRRLSGLSHAAERPHEPPACRGVCPRAVACVRRDGRGTFRCTDGAHAVSCRLSRPRVRGGLRPRSGPRDKRCTNLGERKPPADPVFFRAQTRRGNRWVTRSQRYLTLRTRQGFSHVTSEHSKCSWSNRGNEFFVLFSFNEI